MTIILFNFWTREVSLLKKPGCCPHWASCLVNCPSALPDRPCWLTSSHVFLVVMHWTSIEIHTALIRANPKKFRLAEEHKLFTLPSVWPQFSVVCICVCQKLLTLLACTLQSLIKMLAVPFVDQCSFERPGWIFLSRNRILSEKRPSSSAFRALMILIESEHKHIRLSSQFPPIFILFLTGIDKFLSQHFFKNKQGHFKSLTEQEGDKNGLTSLCGCALPFGASGVFSLCWV